VKRSSPDRRSVATPMARVGVSRETVVGLLLARLSRRCVPRIDPGRPPDARLGVSRETVVGVLLGPSVEALRRPYRPLAGHPDALLGVSRETVVGVPLGPDGVSGVAPLVWGLRPTKPCGHVASSVKLLGPSRDQSPAIDSCFLARRPTQGRGDCGRSQTFHVKRSTGGWRPADSDPRAALNSPAATSRDFA
jgi:hypothetical protein